VLADLNLKDSYRTDECNIVAEFYVPCLSESILYRRAVGFFSSSALAAAAKGLNVFLKKEGRMELVASPLLSEADIRAITEGYAKREELEERSVVNALSGNFDRLISDRLSFLAFLIQHHRLDIKIVTLSDTSRFGIYHEKVGIFSDGRDFVAFTGSPNESAMGLTCNFESIDVYCSWKSEDRSRALQKLKHFEQLWNDCTPGLRVWTFPEAAKKALLRFRQEQIVEDPELVSAFRNGAPSVPPDLTLRSYQVEAIDNWFAANGRGTLRMATGSGKTITALATAARLSKEIDLEALIIVCPYRHLVQQWSKEASRFGLRPILCFESQANWAESLRTKLYALSAGSNDFVCAITTNATFSSEAFQSCIKYFPRKTLLIGDEAHNLGSATLSESLPKSVRLRLALSATPERWFDEEGTTRLFEYFGEVIKPEFTLKEALKHGALVPYYYYPIFVELTDDEAEEYIKLSRQIGKLLDANNTIESPSPSLSMLLFKRARLLASAQNKLDCLRNVMADRLNTSHTLFYCGDGTVEDKVSGDELKQVDAVCRLLGYDMGYTVEKYTAETPLEEREELRRRFESGDLQGIVAIRCLDEGVDIPATKTAVILASSSNPRQFIQRRGRVLRPHPDKRYAEIFDMIVLPPREADMDIKTQRAILEPELRRYMEFAALAKNRGKASAKVLPLKKRLGLLHL